MDIGKVNEAIKYFTVASKLKPREINAWYQLGYAYFRKGKGKQAIKYYKKVLKIDRDHKETWHELAHCYVLLKNFKKAEECIKTEIKFKKSNSHSWETFGDILLAQNKIKEAIAAYENALKRKNHSDFVIANLGVASYRIGKITTAKEYLEEANKKIKNNTPILHFLGHVNSDLGRYDHAIKFFNLELKIGKKNSETLYEIGKAYAGLKKFKEAEVYLKNSLKMEKTIEPWIKLAEVLASQKKFKQSAQVYQKMEAYKKKKPSKRRKNENPITSTSTIHEIVPAPIKEKNVFIVHGHDSSTLRTVSKFIDQKLGLNSLILDKLPPRGRYLMEKIEDYLTESGFVVVLLTPDDIGYPKKKINPESYRARQNVILEYGLSRGKLGRNKICILYKGNVELPIDILGVNYVQIDQKGKWKQMLKSDLQHSNMKIKR